MDGYWETKAKRLRGTGAIIDKAYDSGGPKLRVDSLEGHQPKKRKKVTMAAPSVWT